MSGYAHEMGDAQELWRKTINFPEVGKIVILASIQEAHLDPQGKDKTRYIGMITFSCYPHDGGGSSGYLFSKWYDTQKQAINELMRKLFISGDMILDVKAL